MARGAPTTEATHQIFDNSRREIEHFFQLRSALILLITFSFAFPSGITPFVIASGVQASFTNQLFSVHTHTISNVSFQYAKTFIGFSGNSITNSGGAQEAFSWIAISS